MKNLIQKWGWVLIGVFVVLVLVIGGNFTYNLFRVRADAAAKAKYETIISEKDAIIQAGEAEKEIIRDGAAEAQKTLRDNAAKKIRDDAETMRLFKSETAIELRKRQATINEVLREKVKDEIVIIERGETIQYLGTMVYATLWAWKINTDNLAQVQTKIDMAKDSQIAACKNWTARLEKRLKLTLWGKIKEGAKYAVAFGAGYATGRGTR